MLPHFLSFSPSSKSPFSLLFASFFLHLSLSYWCSDMDPHFSHFLHSPCVISFTITAANTTEMLKIPESFFLVETSLLSFRSTATHWALSPVALQPLQAPHVHSYTRNPLLKPSAPFSVSLPLPFPCSSYPDSRALPDHTLRSFIIPLHLFPNS